MIEQIKARIVEIEAHILQLVQSHTAATGHLAEAKIMLDLATKAADEIAPGSVVDNVLDVVDHVVDEVVPAAE